MYLMFSSDLSALGLFSCLSSRSRAAPSTVYPRKALWPLKFQSSSPTCCKNLRKSAPLVFTINSFGKLFSLCISLYTPLSHAFLHGQDSLPLHSTYDLFLLQSTLPHFLTSSMWPLLSLLCSFFCQSSHRFLGYLKRFDTYVIVFEE